MTSTGSHFVDVSVGTDYAEGKLHIVGSMTVDGVTRIISERIVELEDAVIRQKLIQLGWTPPEGSPTEYKAP